MLGPCHTARLEDNLLPSLSATTVTVLREQLGAGAGGELRPTASGKRRAHAAYSSAAAAFNLLGPWLGHEGELEIAGLGGFTEPLQLERKIRIRHGGGTANLDAFLASSTAVVGVESKLTEHLGVHQPTTWKPPYRSREMAELLDGPWRAVLDLSLGREWQPTHLDLEQLIKHALALRSIDDERGVHLVYAFWEPSNAEDVPEVVAHREEVATLRKLVEGAELPLHCLTHRTLLDHWQASGTTPWFAPFAQDLRARYDIAL